MNAKLKVRLIISIAVLTLSFTFVVIKDRSPRSTVDQTDTGQPEQQEELQPSTIYVDISGEVLHPDVYELESGSRVYEVINMAGGVSEKAYLKGMNLAKVVTDAEKVVVPKHELVSTMEGLIPINIIDKGESTVYVSVNGAVSNPSIIVIGNDKRVVDAIEGAGGLLELAEDASINMAQKLEDGMTIYVPYELSEDEKASRININTATKDELMTLDGIGEVIAGNIVAYRQNNGYFNHVEDLLNISGIGDKKLEAIREKIVIY